MSLSFSSGQADIYKDFVPAVKNLYNVSIFAANGYSQDDIFNSKYPNYHATSVKIGDEELSLQRNDILKQFCIDESSGYKWANSLSIRWREDQNWTIRKYHEAWIDIIYDKRRDVFKQAIESPYKTISITLPSGVVIVCEGVLPKNIGDIDLAWGKQGSIVEPQLNYYVSRVKMI